MKNRYRTYNVKIFDGFGVIAEAIRTVYCRSIVEGKEMVVEDIAGQFETRVEYIGVNTIKGN